jgi:hypothetical protein
VDRWFIRANKICGETFQKVFFGCHWSVMFDVINPLAPMYRFDSAVLFAEVYFGVHIRKHSLKSFRSGLIGLSLSTKLCGLLIWRWQTEYDWWQVNSANAPQTKTGKKLSGAASSKWYVSKRLLSLSIAVMQTNVLPMQTCIKRHMTAYTRVRTTNNRKLIKFLAEEEVFLR